MTSIQPTSSAPITALAIELRDYGTLFGVDPRVVTDIGAELPGGAGRRLSRRIDLMRSRLIPRMLASLNTQQVAFVRRRMVADDANPLRRRAVETLDYVYGAVTGPTARDLQSGFLARDELSVVVAASELDGSPTGVDAVRIDGVDYDIVRVQGYPQVPTPAAYRLAIRKS